MTRQINATGGRHGGIEQVQVDKHPDSCPICHHGIEPITTSLAHVVLPSGLQVVFQCPRQRCQCFFISSYWQRYDTTTFYFDGSAPFKPVSEEFPKHTALISPSFCAIFNEARNAEMKDWKLIAGPGYRKALEFLIKDYLCKLKPEEAEKIKRSQLGSCIEAFVDDVRIKQTAKRAAWLGNDETHYVRKWEDKDLEDLKDLISLTVHWIEAEAITNKMLSEMPEG